MKREQLGSAENGLSHFTSLHFLQGRGLKLKGVNIGLLHDKAELDGFALEWAQRRHALPLHRVFDAISDDR